MPQIPVILMILVSCFFIFRSLVFIAIGSYFSVQCCSQVITASSCFLYTAVIQMILIAFACLSVWGLALRHRSNTSGKYFNSFTGCGLYAGVDCGVGAHDIFHFCCAAAPERVACKKRPHPIPGLSPLPAVLRKSVLRYLLLFPCFCFQVKNAFEYRCLMCITRPVPAGTLSHRESRIQNVVMIKVPEWALKS
jgi:hypothetical protein